MSDKPQKPEEYVSQDEEERLVSTLLSGGEALAEPYRDAEKMAMKPNHAVPLDNDRPTFLKDMSALRELTDMVCAWANADPHRIELLECLRRACGDGEMLRVLFNNLFPGQIGYVERSADGKRKLTEREIEILREAAGDRTREEIAERLNISTRTVNRHLENIYEELNVNRPMQAVARAIVMGYLDMDAFDFIRTASRCGLRDYGLFNTVAGYMSGIELIPEAAPDIQRLAECGLLLLTLSAAMISPPAMDRTAVPRKEPGGIVEIDAQGRIVRLFGTERLLTPRGIVIAPPHAERQGFTPGHLFVAHWLPGVQGLNQAEIVEFTQVGECVCAFTGGQEVTTRLGGQRISLAFAQDGCLLATSCAPPDGIVEFSRNGRQARRAAYGCFNQIAVAGSRIYATDYSRTGCHIQILDMDGARLHRFGGTAMAEGLGGIAITSHNTLFVGWGNDPGDAEIREYATNGLFRRAFKVPGFNDAHLTTDDANRLYVPCRQSGDIKVFVPDGTLERCLNLNGALIPYCVVPNEDGALYVSGNLPTPSVRQE
jgi:DNA-binding CsgD family transcriptional regulator